MTAQPQDTAAPSGRPRRILLKLSGEVFGGGDSFFRAVEKAFCRKWSESMDFSGRVLISMTYSKPNTPMRSCIQSR